jgi:hypothetical protein
MISLKYYQTTIKAMKSTTHSWSEYNAGLKNRGRLTFLGMRLYATFVNMDGRNGKKTQMTIDAF